jgi:2-haloalkanoic acid dehalogenase type II
MSSSFTLTNIKGLCFDIYATLINWEDGIYPHLYRLAARLPESNPLQADSPETRETLLLMYGANEKVVEHENPKLAYNLILETAYQRIADKLGVPIKPEEQVAFGNSIGTWPAFSDSVAAMQILSKYYKICVLSNVDNASFARTCAGPLKGIPWDGIYTAEQIGSYKPNHNNYKFALDKFRENWGIEKNEVAMVAQSLDIDHKACKELDFQPGIWIQRKVSQDFAKMGGNYQLLKSQGLINLGGEYLGLGEFAAAVEEAFAEKK